jgi:hypothetical protein
LSSCSTGRSRASKKSIFTQLNLQNNRMKSIALERLFSGDFFLAAAKKVTGLKGFKSKTGMEASKRQRMLLLVLESHMQK